MHHKKKGLKAKKRQLYIALFNYLIPFRNVIVYSAPWRSGFGDGLMKILLSWLIRQETITVLLLNENRNFFLQSRWIGWATVESTVRSKACSWRLWWRLNMGFGGNKGVVCSSLSLRVTSDRQWLGPHFSACIRLLCILLLHYHILFGKVYY